MRTTLTLEDDAVELARRLAKRRRLTLGKAVSELVRRGARQAVTTEARHGLEVVKLPGAPARVRAADVERLLEDLP
jgi:hypothetical protein